MPKYDTISGVKVEVPPIQQRISRLGRPSVLEENRQKPDQKVYIYVVQGWDGANLDLLPEVDGNQDQVIPLSQACDAFIEGELSDKVLNISLLGPFIMAQNKDGRVTVEATPHMSGLGSAAMSYQL